MKFLHDTYYTNAKRPEHNCQDYAINGELITYGKEELRNIHCPFIALSDGCSSSRNVDIGARIISHLAKQHYEENRFKYPELMITHADKIRDYFEVNSDCLDATLTFMVPRIDDKEIDVFMFGDGSIILLDKDERFKTLITVDFEGNAPYYLSYLLNDKRKEVYDEFVRSKQNKTKIVTYQNITREPGQETISNFNTYVDHENFSPFIFNMEEYSAILVTTDGIQSFYDFDNLQKIDKFDIAKELCNIKNIKGEFIKRRCIKMLKDYAIQNIYNTDDFSVGGLIILDNE